MNKLILYAQGMLVVLFFILTLPIYLFSKYVYKPLDNIYGDLWRPVRGGVVWCQERNLQTRFFKATDMDGESFIARLHVENIDQYDPK